MCKSGFEPLRASPCEEDVVESGIFPNSQTLTMPCSVHWVNTWVNCLSGAGLYTRPNTGTKLPRSSLNQTHFCVRLRDHGEMSSFIFLNISEFGPPHLPIFLHPRRAREVHPIKQMVRLEHYLVGFSRKCVLLATLTGRPTRIQARLFAQHVSVSGPELL